MDWWAGLVWDMVRLVAVCSAIGWLLLLAR